MEAPLLPVGDAAFQIFQRAGHAGLAMALQHGQVNEEIRLQRTAADLHIADGGLDRKSHILFQVIKGHAVFLADTVIACHAGSLLRRALADPGAFDHADILHAPFLKISDTAGQNAGMGGGAVIRRTGNDQIGLERHAAAFGNAVNDVGRLQQLVGHPVGVRSVYLIDHRCSSNMVRHGKYGSPSCRAV